MVTNNTNASLFIIYSQIFTNTLFGDIRGILINNESWFVGKDIATCLGYSNPKKAIRDHVDPENKFIIKGSKIERLNININNRGTYLINEPGLYQLISRSKLPSAKIFANWVYSEVLPTMRQIGSTKSMSILREENEKLRQENNELRKQIDSYRKLNPNGATFDLFKEIGLIQVE